ncbi:MAG: hypothetical protein V2A34_13680 [Lentisphaerota bacterium]
MKTLIKAFIIGAMLQGVFAATAEARVIHWSGIDWNCKTGYQSPGLNYYSDSTNNIWIDSSDRLHLKITRASNRWYCAEVFSEKYFYYGEYRFPVASDVTLLDTNALGGLFLYKYSNPLNPLEIDIEFARQFQNMTTNDNTQFGLQYTIGDGGPATNSCYFHTPNETLTTHRFVWTNTQLYFESYTGHGIPGTGTQIAEYTLDPEVGSGIPSVPLFLHLNLYLFKGRLPTDTQNLELVLSPLQIPPPEPDIVLPTITNVLYDFESGATNQWGTRTWWADAANQIFFQTATVHSPTSALLFVTDGVVSHNVITNNLLTTTNWSLFSKIAYWAKVDGLYHATPFKACIQFIEADLDRWVQNVPVEFDSTNWIYSEVDLIKNNDMGAGAFGFSHANAYDDGDPSLGDNIWEPEQIVEVRFDALDPEVEHYSPHIIYYDDVQLFNSGGSQTVDLAVSTGELGFGALTPDVLAHRFVSTNYAEVTYKIENANPYVYWAMVAYTTNAGQQEGIPGTLKTNLYLPLRTWVGRGTNLPPDPQSSWNTQWSFLGDQYTPQWPLADSANPVPSGFKLYFAAESMGAYTQTYSGTVTLELRVD